ncbi:MAG TPA: hypothetical protein VGK26_03665 [Thermoanaerobaculia bacterium]
MNSSNRPTLDEARARLRALGYLDAGVERMLFRPVFEGRGLGGAWLPAIGLGAFGAALASVAAIEGAEGFASLLSAAVVFLHLFLADLLPAALLAALLTPLADRSRAPGPAATAAGFGAAAAVFALWVLGTRGLEREISLRALLWGIPVAAASLFLAAAVRLAFLARAFARSGALPGKATRRLFAAAAAAGLLVAALLFSSRGDSRREPAPPQPSPRTSPTVVLAIDGLDLDGPGKPAAAAALLSRGATGWWPLERLTPPELWTDLASGEPARRHGVRALTRVRALGAGESLRPPLGTSWYFRRLGPLLRTVASAPVSGADRRRLDFWEVAASAGIPSLAVGWWASAPWPGATVVDNRAVLSRSSNGVDADHVATEIFEQELRERHGDGVATLYLPGCDIERENPATRPSAVAQVERLLEDSVARAERGEVVLIVLAADSHPGSAAALGRMVVFDAPAAADSRAARTVRVSAGDVAPSILARSGVPVARDLPGRPAAGLFAAGTLETATVATYGPRIVPPAAAAPESDREYLEKLRSLGYLK